MSVTGEINIRAATNKDCENVQKLVFEILREYGLEPAPDGTDRDLQDIEASYIERGGVFEILEDARGRILGTVGLYPFDEKRIELRKMYFAPEIRGRGLGKKVLERMIDTARAKKFEQMILETASVLKEAVGLYRKFGFRETDEKHTPRCDKSFYLNLD